jgi:farnesyl-diphosphate farnesyltransferase
MALAEAAAATTSAGTDADAEHRALVAHMPRVWRCYMGLHPADREAVAEAVSVLARGMRRYATSAAGIADEAELRDYCWIVAGCIGVMLTRLAARRAPAPPAVEARRLALSPIVGEGLQLTNILLDWPDDVRRGRRYVPATWIAEAGLTSGQLVGAPSPGVAVLADRLERLARAALAAVPDYLAAWPLRMTRYRMFCLWPSLWALASIEHARRDPEFPWGPRRPRLPRGVLWRSAVAALVDGHGDAGVRRLFAASWSEGT